MNAYALKPHTIRCSFHEVEPFRPCCFTPRRIDAEYRLRLVVYETILAVHILSLRSIVESPCREADDMLLSVTDGNGNTATEEIKSSTIFQVQLLCHLWSDMHRIDEVRICRAVPDTPKLAVFLAPTLVGIIACCFMA